MPDYSVRNVKRNSALLAFYKVVSMLLSLIYVPVALNYLGVGLYGIWATILNIVSWVNYFDIGIGNGLRNKLASALAKGESDDGVKSLISSAYCLMTAIVCFVAFVSLLLFAFIDWNSFLNIPSSLYGKAGTVIAASFVLMCLGFVLSICKSLYFAIQKAHVVSLMGVMQQLLMLGSVMLLASVGEGDRLMLTAVAYGLSGLAVEVAFTLVFFFGHKKWTPALSSFEKSKAEDVTNLGVQFFIVQIASLILSTTDNIIVSHLFGPEAVTPYSTAYKLFMVPIGIYTAMLSPYWSSITAQYVSHDILGIKNGMARMKKMIFVPILLCITLAYSFDFVTELWLGQELEMPSGLILSLVLYSVVYSWNAVYSQVANGMSCMRMMMILAVFQAIANIPLSFIFAGLLESSTGVLIGTVITMISSSIVYPFYIKRKLSKQ